MFLPPPASELDRREVPQRLEMKHRVRPELLPHDAGLPVLLPGGEIGRLLSFEHDDEPVRWTYSLEFRGERE
jgi:hypothetical protein